MCGIFGIVGHNAPVPAGLLERATLSLAHRGPDDGGTVLLQDPQHAVEIGLGNRRLAILDLSSLGHQPMNDPATRNWIVYNGELYNFREVRAQLELLGHHFSSRSDTEVILQSYAQWGEDCLPAFRGMFAFALWDARKHRLFAARDPMGVKPLYYFQSDQYFLFSSELRTLLGTGLVPRRIDSAGLANYLTFGSLYDPDTLVQGVSSLPPGHFLTWAEGNVTQTQYWDLLSPEISSNGPAKDANANLRPALEREVAQVVDDSVRMQLVSDVPVGVFLSGGIDSSALVSILSNSGIKPSTFSIVFREADYSEAEYSRAIARQFHTDHHEITVSQSDLLAAIDPAIRAMDLPTMDGINTYFVSQQARAGGVKVALSGLGGDEMFAGYSSFRTVPRMERWASLLQLIPGAVRNPLASLVAAMAPTSDQNRKLTALARGESVHPYFLSRMLFTPEQQSALMPGLKTDSAGCQRAVKTMTGALSRTRGLDSVNRVSYLEARCYMLNTLLRDSDFMSMAHGLEVRVPLLDHHLAERLMALPGAWKLNSGTPKPLLLQALPEKLPDQIVHRPKRGFTIPFEHWLHGALRPVLEDAFARVQHGPLGETLSPAAVRQVWKDFLQGRTSWSRPWALYVLQCWCEHHSVSH